MKLKVCFFLFFLSLLVACFEIENISDPFYSDIEIEFEGVRVASNVSFLGLEIEKMCVENVIKIVLDSKNKIDNKALDAYVDDETWEVVPEREGEILNVELTVLNLMNANDGQDIDPVVEKTKPNVTYEDLIEKIRIIGWHSTFIKETQNDRNFNIKKAADKIDKVKVLPKEEFSFNNVVGQCSLENGYRLAPVIVKEEDEYVVKEGEGGGVCQVSTTLFNATVVANLDILERHSHSKEVGYAPLGEDSAIVWGYSDFRFKNTRKFPIQIRTFVKNNSLCVEIWEKTN